MWKESEWADDVCLIIPKVKAVSRKESMALVESCLRCSRLDGNAGGKLSM